MRSTQQFSITIPNEMAKMIKAKVASGEYASESEVVRDGLRALQARERAFEHWLHTEVVPAAREAEEHPETLLTANQVEDALYALHERTVKSGI